MGTKRAYKLIPGAAFTDEALESLTLRQLKRSLSETSRVAETLRDLISDREHALRNRRSKPQSRE